MTPLAVSTAKLLLSQRRRQMLVAAMAVPFAEIVSNTPFSSLITGSESEEIKGKGEIERKKQSCCDGGSEGEIAIDTPSEEILPGKQCCGKGGSSEEEGTEKLPNANQDEQDQSPKGQNEGGPDESRNNRLLNAFGLAAGLVTFTGFALQLIDQKSTSKSQKSQAEGLKDLVVLEESRKEMTKESFEELKDSINKLQSSVEERGDDINKLEKTLQETKIDVEEAKNGVRAILAKLDDYLLVWKPWGSNWC